MRKAVRMVMALLVSAALAAGCSQDDGESGAEVQAPGPGSSGTDGTDGTTDPVPPGTDPIPFVCVGAKPPQSAWAAEPGPLLPVIEDEHATDGTDEPPPEASEEATEEATDAPDPPAPTEPVLDAAPPAFQLTDFQPQSCGHEATYGLEVFEGRVTVAVLLAAW